MIKKNIKLKVSLILSSLMAAALIFTVSPIAAQAKPAYNTKWKNAYSWAELIAPALSKNTDAKGVYEQLKSGIQYQLISDGDILSLYRREGSVAPVEALRMLNAEGLVSGYLYKTVSGLPLTAADLSDVYNTDYYYNANPDLQLAIGYNPDALFSHFITSGMAEGRQGIGNFNVANYAKKNPAVEKLYGKNYTMYYYHYILFGKAAASRGH